MNMLKKMMQRYLFSTQIPTVSTQNPYLNLFPNQLQPIIKQMLSQSSYSSIQDLNRLIYLLKATQKNRMFRESQKLIKRCVYGLGQIDSVINEKNEDELGEIRIDVLLGIQADSGRYLNMVQRERLRYFYENTYLCLISFKCLLNCYQNTRDDQDLSILNRICQDRIKDRLQNSQINLEEYILYLRLFNFRMERQEIERKLLRLEKYQNFMKIEQNDKLILYFILMNKNVDIDYIYRNDLEPELNIKEYDTPKQTCIKLEILKFRNMEIPNLNGFELINWDYKNLIWLSEFSGKFPLLIEKIHFCIMNCGLGKGMRLCSILTYIENVRLPVQKHSDIEDWLLRECKIQHEQDLCQILMQIHEKKLEILYGDFFAKVLEMSLGNFKWQNQNKIYYFGKIIKSRNENMQYLRRYILNTYASLGTARREISTNSYFYKILEISSVQQFYKNL